jgi:2-(1,2-epoxy-1,2-dihydrophenyl)acetyl-CoA isomerase
MAFSSLQLEVADGLARLTLTQPARGNPIDGPFCSDLCEAATWLSENSAVRCVLLSAQGKAFSFGGDISAFVADLEALPINIKRWTTPLHSAVTRLQRMNAPIVAAVHGICAGGMSGLVAGSDVVVAAEDARFLAAYAGIGFSCDAGSSVMYARRMGIGRARKFMLMNDTLTARDALAVGLVDEVVPPEQLQSRAEAIARQLASGPTRAYGEMRRLFMSVEDQPLEAQLELEAQALARSSATADAHEGLTAFAAKRKPVFKGQ